MDPNELSHELREWTNPDLKRRRRVAALTLGASASMTVIFLYQLGVIHHLAEPPLPGQNADKVDASERAYEQLDMPDAVLGLGSYATTLALAAMGGANRAWARRPRHSLHFR